MSTLPVTIVPSLRVVTAANFTPLSETRFSTPSRPQRKSRCHHDRRNSPSVIAWRPTSSWRLITRAISRSSTAFRSAAEISFFANFSRADLMAAGRNRLPTWSARNGGFFRSIFITPWLCRRLAGWEAARVAQREYKLADYRTTIILHRRAVRCAPLALVARWLPIGTRQQPRVAPGRIVITLRTRGQIALFDPADRIEPGE